MTITEIEQLIWLRRKVATGEAMRLRAAAGVSLTEVADACRVNVSTIWRWERGQRVPRGTPALTYATILERLDRSTSARLS